MLKEFNDIVPGLRLRSYKVTPSKTQLFMFSAITWNRHQIHFNRDQAESEGFPDVAVQRGLIGNFLAQYVSSWGLQSSRLTNLQWKVLQSTFPGIELTCQGEVIFVSEDQSEKEIHCDLRIVNESGVQVAVGKAKLQLNWFKPEGDEAND